MHLLVAPLAGNLNRRLDTFGAGVHGEDHVVAKVLGGVLGEAWEHIIVECT